MINDISIQSLLIPKTIKTEVTSRGEEHKAYCKAYNKAHKNKIKEQKCNWRKLDEYRNYSRQHNLRTKDGVTHRNLSKRPYTNLCEICDKKVDKNLNYHHWDDTNLNKGIWVCIPCHNFVEYCDKDTFNLYLNKYINLKTLLEKGN